MSEYSSKELKQIHVYKIDILVSTPLKQNELDLIVRHFCKAKNILGARYKITPRADNLPKSWEDRYSISDLK